MACLKSVFASRSVLRANAASCTIRYDEGLPYVALDAFDSGKVDLVSPCGPVVAFCVIAADTIGGLTLQPLPDGHTPSHPRRTFVSLPQQCQRLVYWLYPSFLWRLVFWSNRLFSRFYFVGILPFIHHFPLDVCSRCETSG